MNSLPPFQHTTQAGDFHFVDASGNGILEEDADRVIWATTCPTFTTASPLISWKGLRRGGQIQGVYGSEILNCLETRHERSLSPERTGRVAALPLTAR